MEDLNDVEFGSDKSTEEAPILVAQRYLNIFRQIHIFNKEKRNQFDDELLALPQNITDFFKRMPGGRLLVEHIEDVKTERGISFVKSNRDDFTNGDTSTASTGQNTASSGNNMVMDASFAQTLAASMASVIKQAPAQAVSGGADAAVLANLNKTFQLIAEEIKLSRNSMIEVLQETRQITNSVISSQIAISKLLENLCSGNVQIADTQVKAIKTDEKVPFSPVNARNEQASQGTENTSTQKTEPSLEAFSGSSLGENIKKKKKKKKHNIQQENDVRNITSSPIFQHQDIPEADLAIKSEKIAPAFSGVIRNAASKHNDDFTNVRLDELPQEDISADNFESTEDTSVQDVRPDFTSNNTLSSFRADFTPTAPKEFAEKLTHKTDIDAGIDSFMESAPDFSEPEQTDVLPELHKETISEPIIKEKIDNFPDTDGLDFTLPQYRSPREEQEIKHGQTLVEAFDKLSDGLDYSLPEQNTAFQETEENLVNSLDSLITDDGLDFALPEQSSAIEEEQKKTSDFSDFHNELSDSDGLDFTLPEQNISNNETADTNKLDGLMAAVDRFNTDFQADETDSDFALPKQRIIDDVSDDISGLDSLMNEDGTDFSLSEQDAAHGTITEEPVDFNGLDDLVGSSQEPAFHTEEAAAGADVLSDALDDFIQQDSSHISEEQAPKASQTAHSPEQHSRYSEELDKIRAALTSDSIDVSSINQPIALDDYSDDENVSEDNDADFSNISGSALNSQPVAEEAPSNEEEWEWEYVDENGNPIEGADGEGEDWEWEYVEDDGQENEPDNNNN